MNDKEKLWHAWRLKFKDDAHDPWRAWSQAWDIAEKHGKLAAIQASSRWIDLGPSIHRQTALLEDLLSYLEDVYGESEDASVPT